MKPLLTIAPPDAAFPSDVLDAPGGFAWWYTDMLDAERNGLVLIWSYGLPFLPGYASAARRGTPQTPRSRPSISVAVMERGRLACYLLHELEPEQAQWDGESWRFGDSSFSSAAADGVRTLSIALDCPLPGGQRLQGTVELRGVARRAGAEDIHDHRHDWAPLTGPATTVVRLSAGEHRYEFDGEGYFDGNIGRQPLHEAGIDSWTWGRIPGSDRQRIYYVLWNGSDDPPEATGIEVDHRGVLSRFDLEVDVTSWARGLAQLRFPSTLELRRDGELWANVRAAEVVDDGPFYLRYFIESNHGHGLGEYCRTDRIDLARHRPLVQMRVQREAGDNSMWLPLFAGPRQGRVQRLLSQFMEG